jgi:hypothetical protein
MGKKKSSKKKDTPDDFETKETQPSLPGVRRQGTLLAVVSISLLAAVILLLIYALPLRGKVDRYDRNLVACSLELEKAQQQVEDNQKEMAKMKYELEASTFVERGREFLTPEYMEAYRKKGLGNPTYNIPYDLYKRSDLIPYKGTNGETMKFRRLEEIFILGPNRAFASFGDSNIFGWMFLQYRVGEGGKITWKVLESYCPYYDK